MDIASCGRQTRMKLGSNPGRGVTAKIAKRCKICGEKCNVCVQCDECGEKNFYAVKNFFTPLKRWKKIFIRYQQNAVKKIFIGFAILRFRRMKELKKSITITPSKLKNFPRFLCLYYTQMYFLAFLVVKTHPNPKI